MNDIAVPKNIESIVRGENQSERQRTQGRARREYDVKVQSQRVQHVQIEETVEQSNEKSADLQIFMTSLDHSIFII